MPPCSMRYLECIFSSFQNRLDGISGGIEVMFRAQENLASKLRYVFDPFQLGSLSSWHLESFCRVRRDRYSMDKEEITLIHSFAAM